MAFTSLGMYPVFYLLDDFLHLFYFFIYVFIFLYILQDDLFMHCINILVPDFFLQV